MFARGGESEAERDPASIRQRLGLGEGTAAWLASLPASDADRAFPVLAERDAAAALLTRLAVPSIQVDEAVRALPLMAADPALRWLLGRCAQLLVEQMGRNGPIAPWPALPDALGLPGRYFYAVVFLTVLPDVRRYHQQRGVPDDISWATLADMGRHMAIHQRVHGEGGLSSHNWLTLHYRGLIYELGRLQ
ncbi:MAG TPA: acyltransferase domain-containing protein, partial [Chloroflexota bacterium]|nr:acyltransferase domain-containing protein [Chloroflexota bacterium]